MEGWMLLYFIACMLADTKHCQTMKVQAPEGMGIMQCMREAQLPMRDWAESHQGWFIKRWRCSSKDESEI